MIFIKKINIESLLINILISEMFGVFNNILSFDGYNTFLKLNRPYGMLKLGLFPFIWMFIYFIMGVCSYIIYRSYNKNSKQALLVYFLHLLSTTVWVLIFFKFKLIFLALVWGVLCIYLCSIFIKEFYKINIFAGIINIPYLIWLTYLLYLNIGFFVLN